MSHFKNATSEFKKRLAHQPIIQRAVVTPLPAQDDGPMYTGSNANPNNNGAQVYRASKKKKTEGMNMARSSWIRAVGGRSTCCLS